MEWTTGYGDGRIYRNVSIAKLREGKAARLTDHWGQPFTPPAWRRPPAERLVMPPNGTWPAACALIQD